MSDPPTPNSDPSLKEKKRKPSSTPEEDVQDRIVILGERDVPFQEQRPPNLSPNFEVNIHRVHQRKLKEGAKE
ncbi:MAG: hypothetical protein ACFE89_03290 [Candidatus Hodarchaeota archaeon]